MQTGTPHPAHSLPHPHSCHQQLTEIITQKSISNPFSDNKKLSLTHAFSKERKCGSILHSSVNIKTNLSLENSNQISSFYFKTYRRNG